MTATTATKKTRATRSKPAGAAKPPAPKHAPTLGPKVCAWIEKYVVHGEGDYYGKPFKLRPWQRMVIYRAYELTPTGQRRWRRVLLGLPKGNGKTELAAAIAEAELAGPVVFTDFDAQGRPRGEKRSSPEIPVAAASFEQADILFAAARVMSRQGPLAGLCEVYDTEIQLRGQPGRLYRVAAAAGTNDGARPTFSVRDEVHEWTGPKERVHLVLENNLAKRKDTWGLDISTAGWDPASLLGRMYTIGRRIEAGELTPGESLMIWFEADRALNLEDPAQFEEACRQANPALGDFLQLEALRSRYREMPEHEFRRYHLNQWVDTPTRWLPAGAWDARIRKIEVKQGEPVALALEGEWSGGTTSLVGCTLARPRHLFMQQHWEQPVQKSGWRPPTLEELRGAITKARERYQVTKIGINPARWPELYGELETMGLPVVEWPSHVTARIAPACRQFFDAVVVQDDATHDGNPDLTRHVGQALVKEDNHGRLWISKAAAAVAAVVAIDLAIRGGGQTTSVYETRGILEFG